MTTENLSTTAFEPRKYFVALDSWRGICACAFIFLHVNAYSHFFFTPLTRNAGLFVDFFFVLSGFVIASNYEARLQEGYSAGKFMFLRIGRLYPIHLLMLVTYVAFEFLFADMISSVSATGREAFAGSTSIEAIWVNLLMLQGVGVLDYASWNFPSWSVSTELAAYFLFALGAIYLRKNLWIPLVILVLASPYWIYSMAAHTIDDRFILLARCLAGFAGGVLCLHAFRRAEEYMLGMSVAVATLLELLALAFVGWYLYIPENPMTYAFPVPIFFVAVLVFANQGGLISRWLMVRPLVLIGTLSYSIYMVHAFLTARIGNVIQLAVSKFNLDFYTPYETLNNGKVNMFGKELWQGDLVYLLMLSSVVGASYLTYRLIEAPSRDAFRRQAARIWPSENAGINQPTVPEATDTKASSAS